MFTMSNGSKYTYPKSAGYNNRYAYNRVAGGTSQF